MGMVVSPGGAVYVTNNYDATVSVIKGDRVTTTIIATRELMTFMGHSTMSATLIYKHTVEDRMAGLSAAMSTQIPRLPSEQD